MRWSRTAVTRASWLLAIVLGAVHAWADRFRMNADGISYLDMGEAYWRGAWGAAVNAYWSPLYSWLLGLALVLVEPTPYWEFPVAHLVNFLVYVGALAAFHLLLTELIGFHQSYRADDSGRHIGLPVWAWLLLGYALFTWSSLALITMSEVTPDMCVAAFVYLAAAIVLRIRREPAGWVSFALLGLVLGFAYLAKAPMLPLGLVFLGVAVLSVPGARRAIPRGVVALLVFVAVAGPFILALSSDNRRLTFGESGRLTYARFVNGVPVRHWQGAWPPGSGRPEHPTRKIFEKPAIYEYGSPIGGTYPPWYDPAYWYEGITPRLDLRRQAAVVANNLRIYLQMFVRSEGVLIVGFLVLFVAGARGRSCLKDIGRQWALLVPAVAALAMYALVYVEPRYLASFLVLLWLGIASAVRLPDAAESRRTLSSVAVALGIGLLLIVGVATVRPALSLAHDLLGVVRPGGLRSSAHTQWRIAEALRQHGVQPGDKVGIVGQGTDRFYAYWARLARVQIVAEIPSGDVNEFLASDKAVRARVLEAFAGSKAKAVVADHLPTVFADDGWQSIGHGHFVYWLR